MRNLFTLFLLSFSRKNLVIHLTAITLTYILVISGVDWNYFLLASRIMSKYLLFTADIVGFVVPILTPLIFMILGKHTKRAVLFIQGKILGYSVATAFMVSIFYKSLTGRISPPLHEELVDVSNQFNFGFMEHSVIGGWPSSHATVLFSLATCLVLLFPKSRSFHYGIYILATYIAVSETIGFHWLSECIAGILIGIAVGKTVFRYFNARTTS